VSGALDAGRRVERARLAHLPCPGSAADCLRLSNWAPFRSTHRR